MVHLLTLLQTDIKVMSKNDTLCYDLHTHTHMHTSVSDKVGKEVCDSEVGPKVTSPPQQSPNLFISPLPRLSAVLVVSYPLLSVAVSGLFPC